ncbi:MAG: S8 family peptidase [Bacteriovorax sp.]|nr:S8 family peptidase [Bacteriovorax sp.]
MNLKLSLTVFIFLSAHSYAATPFNGYIVKLKNTDNFLADKSVSKMVNIEKLTKTSFGNFAKIAAKDGFLEQSLESLKKNPNIEYIEPNYIITLKKSSFVPNVPSDTFFEKQWGLKNTGDHDTKLGEDINATKAWEITKGSKEVKIAVLDSGIDYNHPDLKNQIEINEAEKNGLPGVDDDNNGYIDDIYGYDFNAKKPDPMDGNGHGTHCAGVIGAQHDGLGVVGVMANVKLIPVKFLDDKGAGEDIDAVAAIDYAIKRGAKVMSNSWGSDEKVQALYDAIKAAEKAGIVFVVAAGNDGADNDRTPSYPNNFDISNIIAVGASNNRGNRASFSNYGSKTVHVFAPGEDIFSTVNNGEYDWMSGTSMAAPFVSGIVGLLLSKEPNLSPKEIRERLIRTSVDNKKLQGDSASNGRVDAYRALMNK